MAIDSITSATTTDRSCSEPASDKSGCEGEHRPAGDEKKGNTTEAGAVCLKKFLREVRPDYLKLLVTPSSNEKYRWGKRPREVSLAHVDARLDYLSLSVTPSDELERQGGRDVSGGGGSVGAEDASSVASSGGVKAALVAVDAVLSPLPQVQIARKHLPPKKRKLAAAGVRQESAGTAGAAPASSSPYLAPATVNHRDGVSRSSTPSGTDGETCSSVTIAFHPIDAVPLQAVYVHGGVAHQFMLSSGAGEIITTNDAASTSSSAAAPPEPAWIRETLGLTTENQLIFIASKRVQRSDIDTQQSRFMIPRGDANDRLLPLLTPDERRAAGLHEAWERPKPQPSAGEHEGEKSRVQGKEHGGLVVPVVINRAGRQMDARLTRWESTGSTVLKFGKSKGFVVESGLRKDDLVEIWAFRRDGGLHLVIAKIDGETEAAAAGWHQVGIV